MRRSALLRAVGFRSLYVLVFYFSSEMAVVHLAKLTMGWSNMYPTMATPGFAANLDATRRGQSIEDEIALDLDSCFESEICHQCLADIFS